MLLWTALLCLLSASLVASRGLPDTLAEYNPGTMLKPSKDSSQKQDGPGNVNLVRSLLIARQTQCPSGYEECVITAPGRLVALLLLRLLFLSPLCFPLVLSTLYPVHAVSGTPSASDGVILKMYTQNGNHFTQLLPNRFLLL